MTYKKFTPNSKLSKDSLKMANEGDRSSTSSTKTTEYKKLRPPKAGDQYKKFVPKGSAKKASLSASASKDETESGRNMLRSLSTSAPRPSVGKQGEYERLDPEELEREARRLAMETRRAKMKSPLVPLPDIDEPVIKEVIVLNAPELEVPTPAEKHSPDRDSHREPPEGQWLDTFEEDGYELMEWQVQGRKTPYCALKFPEAQAVKKKSKPNRNEATICQNPCCIGSIVLIVLLSLGLAGVLVNMFASGEAASVMPVGVTQIGIRAEWSATISSIDEWSYFSNFSQEKVGCSLEAESLMEASN